MNITASMVKELRDRTAAGMSDCKNALVESNGDMEAAADWLRQKGIVKAAKKAGRVAASGLVSAVKKDGFASVIEVNAETDFVAKNEKFQDLVTMIGEMTIAKGGDFDEVLAGSADEITNTIATIGENMTLRRIASVKGDAVFTYIHNAMKSGMGQIGVAVAINGDKTKTAEIGPKIAMHIAAMKPEFMTIADVDTTAVEREKKIFIESGVTNGKPAEIAEKMTNGRIQKYYAESVLEEQPFVMDPSKTVKQTVLDNGGTLAGFAMFVLGEGIEKSEDNLADEVAKLIG